MDKWFTNLLIGTSISWWIFVSPLFGVAGAFFTVGRQHGSAMTSPIKI